MSYAQIDYIITNINHKHLLTDARAYSGTETSDHRLLITRVALKWYNVFRKSVKTTGTKRFNTELLADPATQTAYRLSLQNALDNLQPEERIWDIVKVKMKDSAEATIGYKPPSAAGRTRDDPEILQWSQQSRDLRVRISNTANPATVMRLKLERNQISHLIRRKCMENYQQKVSAIVNSIENAESARKMFQAVKVLKRKALENQFVFNDQGQRVTQPQEVHDIIKNHFQKHFNDAAHHPVEPFDHQIRPLDNKIATDEVSAVVKKMSNGAPGYDNLSADLYKYAPPAMHQLIAEVLNRAVEQHQPLEEISRGQLAALWKPNKPKGPVTNKRPIILLTILRKILSNITLKRIRPLIDQFLAPSQSAYTPNRSTTDIVWAHRWIAAKVQEYNNLAVYITGIDMSSAFDTINRSELINTLQTFIPDDEMRFIRLLLSNTTLEVKVQGAKQELFGTNVGSPQGDGISGPLFNVYFEKALRQLRLDISEHTPPPNADHQYNNPNRQVPAPTVESDSDEEDVMNTAIPPEMVYADDADFCSTEREHPITIKLIAAPSLKRHNLLVNTTKTEETVIRRGKKGEERWRHVKKLGSLIGDPEDINNRKQLAIVAFRQYNAMWLSRTRLRLSVKLKLFQTLVKSVLLYNSSCWGMRKQDEDSLNSLHRSYLRKLCKIFWPQTISNRQLYRKTKTQPISIDIVKARWKYFGHALRLPRDTPPQQAMTWYFKPELNQKRASGGRRTTIVSTIRADIRQANQHHRNFDIPSLESLEDLNFIRVIAQDRNQWRLITKAVVDSAKAKLSSRR